MNAKLMTTLRRRVLGFGKDQFTFDIDWNNGRTRTCKWSVNVRLVGAVEGRDRAPWSEWSSSLSQPYVTMATAPVSA